MSDVSLLNDVPHDPVFVLVHEKDKVSFGSTANDSSALILLVMVLDLPASVTDGFAKVHDAFVPLFEPMQSQLFIVLVSAVSENDPALQLLTVVPHAPFTFATEHNAVVPPFAPTHDQLFDVLVSAVSEKVPALQLLIPLPHTPLSGATVTVVCALPDPPAPLHEIENTVLCVSVPESTDPLVPDCHGLPALLTEHELAFVELQVMVVDVL